MVAVAVEANDFLLVLPEVLEVEEELLLLLIVHRGGVELRRRNSVALPQVLQLIVGVSDCLKYDVLDLHRVL